MPMETITTHGYHLASGLGNVTDHRHQEYSQKATDDDEEDAYVAGHGL